MAYVLDLTEEEKKKQEEQSTLSGQNGTIVGGQPGSAGQAPVQKKASTGWTNLVDYVDANKEQSLGLANKVVDNVKTDANAATGLQNTAKNTVNTQVAANTVNLDNDLITGYRNDPAAIAADKAKADALEAQRKAAWKGPNVAADIKDVTDANAAVKNVVQKGDGVRSFEGKQVVLQDVFNKPERKTARKLDSFLAGHGAAGESLENNTQEFTTDGTYSKGWDDLTGTLNTTIQTGKDTTKATSDAANKAVDDEWTEQNDVLTTAGTTSGTQNTANTAALTELGNNLNSGDANVRNTAYAKAGVDPATGEWLRSQGYDLKKLLQAGNLVKAGDLISPEQRKQIEAAAKFKGANIATDAFATGGGKAGEAFKQAEAAKKAKEAYEYQQMLKERQRLANETRKKELEAAKVRIKSEGGLRELGLSADEAGYLAALSNEVNIEDLLTGGRDLDIADVANDGDRSNWGSLISQLGIGGGLDLTDKGDEGSAFNFNAGEARNRLNAFKDKKAKEAEAARIAEENRLNQIQANNAAIEAQNNPRPATGGNEGLNKTTSGMEKAAAWGSDISDVSKQIVSAPGGAWNDITGALLNAPAPKINIPVPKPKKPKWK